MTALRLAAVLLCVLYISDAAFSVSSTRCCTQLGENVSKSLLKQVKRYSIQRQDGTCHLQAVLLHLKRKILCISPKNKKVEQWIKSQEGKSSVKQPSRNNRPGRKKRRDKLRNKKKKTKKRNQQLV
ncbi:C-C motif chemokine 28 [Dendropsophus ebraccatus]|uniref:C-C motif chemokine 28 n=1 Tax=Dendropsophus ebraccatus TaxID=150705 RepID=UPI003831C7A6